MNTHDMKRGLGLALALLLLLGALLPDTAAARKNRYDKVIEDLPELRDFQVPEVTREELSNGMVLYLVEDHDLPVIRLGGIIRAGSIYEPGAKTGLASLLGTVMRTGGTDANPGDVLDQRLEDMGASVETGMRNVSASASLRCLAENFDEVLAIYADILRNPAFPQEKIDLALTQSKTAISRRNDDASGIAGREISKLYYGADSPYARHPEYDTLSAIERGDLVAFHEYFFHPNNIILVAGGDFDTAEMIGKLEAAFGDWPKGDTFYPPDPVLEETPMSVNLIQKDDVNQSKVRMGHLGIRWDDEHLFPLQVLNQILGGGFSSRLFSKIRSQHELAYGVWAWMITGNHHRMPFTVGVDTKSESTVEAIELIIEELVRVREEPVTQVELDRAKDGLKNSFVFNFSSPYSIARRKASYEFHGRPQDYLDTYLAKVDAVSAEDILAAARARIHPDEMAILVVGKSEDFDKPLSSLGHGDPSLIDITIPEPSFEVELPAATEETLAEGRALMLKTVEAYGGAAKIAALETVDTELDFTMPETGMGPLTFGIHSRRMGDKLLRVDTSTPFGSMTQILTGDVGWIVSPRGKQEVTGDELAELWEGEKNDQHAILRGLDGFTTQSLGAENLDGVGCDVVYLTGESGKGYKVFLGADHLIHAMEYKDQGQSGPVMNLTITEDFTAAGGVMFPRSAKVHHDGTLFATVKVKSVKVNEAMAKDLFTEPKE